MRLLIWQWGRRGGGPRYAAELLEGMRQVTGVEPLLSLPAGAELLTTSDSPHCALVLDSYAGAAGLLWRLATFRFRVRGLAAQLRRLAPDAAICALPGPLDLVMAAALSRIGVPFAVVVHDADPHPGDGFPFQMALQRHLMAGADALVALSVHVGDRLRTQGALAGRPLIVTSHPPRLFGPTPPPPLCHGGKWRLLSFGRLLPYKGLDLLAGALERVGSRPDMEMRIVGQGPESAELARLRALPNVSVENRWVPEDEIGSLIAWSDALVLSHREASQSGAAGAAIGAGRFVVATKVGGLAEQLGTQNRAILCEPTAAAIAEALSRLLDDPPTATQVNPAAEWHTALVRLAGDLRAALLTS